MEDSLNRYTTGDAPELLEAIRYSALGGGKRIRGVLVFAAAAAAGHNADPRCTAAIASAVEFTHAYSLIHDDLPAMDNDDLRRGKPSCHIAFGEGIAILAGDALQVLAFEVLAGCEGLDAGQRNRIVQLLAEATGVHGMAGGQALDLLGTGKKLSLQQLEQIHRAKTGALIRASILMGAICARANPQTLATLDRFSHPLGLAFQIQDDLLDQTETTETLGKSSGADQSMEKTTWPSVAGIQQTRHKLRQLYRQCLESIDTLALPCSELRLTAEYIVTRNC